MVTNVYSLIYIHGKTLLWAHIRYVRSCAPFLPWVLASDFNSVLSFEEKGGGLATLGPSSDLFCENVDLLHLIDIKLYNGVYTWNNRWCIEEPIFE